MPEFHPEERGDMWKCPQEGEDGVHVVLAAEKRQLHPASPALCAESGVNVGGFPKAL